jgi:RimJ/RimL family protein N-acetyltransferase
MDAIRREAELGITIGERGYWSQGYGRDAVATVVRHIFRTTGFRRVYLKSLEWNERAQRAFEHAGFRTCGRLRRGDSVFVIMEYMAAWLDLEPAG